MHTSLEVAKFAHNLGDGRLDGIRVGNVDLEVDGLALRRDRLCKLVTLVGRNHVEQGNGSSLRGQRLCRGSANATGSASDDLPSATVAPSTYKSVARDLHD